MKRNVCTNENGNFSTVYFLMNLRILISMMFVATLSEHLLCNRLFFTLAQPMGFFICGSVLFILCSNTVMMRAIVLVQGDAMYMRWKMSFSFCQMKCRSLRYVLLLRCAPVYLFRSFIRSLSSRVYMYRWYAESACV